MDDLLKLFLDAIELLSEIFILLFCQGLGPRSETRWQRKLPLIPYERPHVMDGVEGLLLTILRLLNAGELRYVGEHTFLAFSRPREAASL